MRLFITILTFFFSSSVYSQSKCTAIIDWKYLKMVDIYDKPVGKIISQMQNDSINEEYLHLSIIEQTESYFHVSIDSTVERDASTGWIRKADYIGAYKKHETFPMDLILYKDKKISKKNKILIANWMPTLLTIEKCFDDWAFVSFKQNGKLFKGWIEVNELCANAYTYCN